MVSNSEGKLCIEGKIISEYVPDKPTQLFLLKNLDREGKDKYVLKVNLKTLKDKIEKQY